MLRDGLFYHTSPQQQALPSGNIVFVQIAAIWGAIAYGAYLVRDGRADAYSDCARAALQHCFEEPSPDAVRTYLLMESLATFTTCMCSVFMNAPCDLFDIGSTATLNTTPYKMFKFAEILCDELQNSGQYIDPEIDACMNSCRVSYVMASGFVNNWLSRYAHRAQLVFDAECNGRPQRHVVIPANIIYRSTGKTKLLSPCPTHL